MLISFEMLKFRLSKDCNILFISALLIKTDIDFCMKRLFFWRLVSLLKASDPSACPIDKSGGFSERTLI